MTMTVSPSMTNVPRIGFQRNLHGLVDWAADFARQAKANGQRVMWAPAHALGGCVSLRTWILDQAAAALGDSAPEETPLLLSGAADVIVLLDPGSADGASLNWLTDMILCAESVADLASVPPLPQLVVLATSRASREPAAATFLDKLEALGCEDIRFPARGAEPPPADYTGLLGRNDELLAAIALAPVPLTLEDLNAVAKATGKSGLQVSELLDCRLMRMAGDFAIPSAAEIKPALRQKLPPEALARGAALLLPLVESRYESLPDARVELSLRSGDSRRATKLARRRYDEHIHAGRLQEALRLLTLCRELKMPLEGGKFGAEIDEARMGWLHAQLGNHDAAREIVFRLARLRAAFGQREFVQWVGLAGRILALAGHFDARQADSLLRRAIRLADGDLDAHVTLTLQRVSLLSSDIMKLGERSGWLLTHINNEMLEEVAPATLAQYLEDTAVRLWKLEDVRGAIRRLRKLLVMDIGDVQMSRALLLMARCRLFVSDNDAALRFATGALQHALRAANLDLVNQAAVVLRDMLSRKPRELPPLAPPGKGARSFPRIPAVAGIQAPPLADVNSMFDVLQARFRVTGWVRRRGGQVSVLGKSTPSVAQACVYDEQQGNLNRLAGAPGSAQAVSLLRADGSDLVFLESDPELETRVDSLLRLLLSDRETADTAAEAPRRNVVLADYHRRALDHGIAKGLHATMEMLFNKDVLLYFEEQGIGKDEMARKLDVSRATLYRMYARAGLNI